MVKSRRGISVLEVLVAGTLLVILFLASQKVILSFFRGFASVDAQNQKQVAINNIVAYLQKYIAPGDLRFMAFSGRGGVGDRVLARFLVARPGRCGDLAPCPENTALIYPHYDRGMAPSVSVICALDPQTFLADLRNPNYGNAAFVGGNFNVAAAGGSSFGSGVVNLPTNTLLGLSNPPAITLWVSQGPAVQHNVAAAALPADCQQNLQAGSPVDRLYRVRVEPLILSSITGGNAVSNQERTDSFGKFPMRIFNVAARVVGVGPAPFGLGVRQCNYAAGGNFACPGAPLFEIPQVTRVRINHSFKQRIVGSNAQQFQVLDAAQATFNCDAPICEPLRANNPAAIPVMLAGETFSNLLAQGFSLIKLDSISKMTFEIASGTKQENFHVLFP